MDRTLLELPISVEPDRRRLARFAVEAVRALGGSAFSATAVLTTALQTLRQAACLTDASTHACLAVHDGAVVLGWADARHILSRLPSPPPAKTLDALADRLRQVSESADPELLRRRNQQIESDLEKAKERAAQEMAQLEADLEHKKSELQSSIRKAETDSLTGLFNRGAFDSRLREGVLQCSRQGEPLGLILLDLDFFKEVNDTHGHQYGDQYLQQMAEAMRASIREHVDKPCRIGGDEFAILVYGDNRVVNEVARRVLKGVNQRVSIGVAQLREGDTVDTLIARADAALYDAKRRGRGRIACSEHDPIELAPEAAHDDPPVHG
ncbi:diguanylate cyclase [Thioalkalivibrio sp. ALMg13-2]|uniref:GGDEF domain-containing protein n=1 Tax=Thioalkalivibrio sp. ALMg13-2 TaxID=1158167 RepID=UPI0003670EB6|nr:GGDEF domain-containing protein [Thioalkalivibrio sp. ALMg13-2]